MLPDLARLLRLQQLETRAEEARRQITEHPQRLNMLEAELQEKTRALQEAHDRLARCQADRRTLEKELSVVQNRLGKYRDQLMEVKTNKEYQAMQKEIEVTQGELRRLEDRMLERMLEADDLAAEVKRAETALATEQSRVAAERLMLEQRLAALERELTETSQARARLVGEIDPMALSTFEKISRVRKGIAMSEAKDGLCSICHVRLRPQVFNDIRRNDAIVQCESCHRILYFISTQPRQPDAIA
jgi:predicted  nucleic acid-binding Zn-ribbon protein